MARTWTLEQTLSIVSGGAFISWERALTNAARTQMYFLVNPVTGNNKIYSWDGGSSLTDITGSSFPIGSPAYRIQDICVFDGDLFCAYTPVLTNTDPTQIHRWTGGTSWTNEYELAGEAADDGDIGHAIAGDSYPWPMDCDASFMHVAGNIGAATSETFRRMWSRDTAGNWTVNQMPGAVYSSPGYQLVGLSKGSDYGTVFGYNRISSTNYRTIERGSPSPWTNLAGSDIGAKVPIGYGDGKSFFSHNTSGNTWELKYSTDWGVNLSAAGGLTFDEAHERAEWKFKNVGSGIIMLATETHQAYTWDPDTDEFVEDGQTTDIDGNRSIFDFFVLGGVLYALTNSVTANSIEIWSAGPIGSAGFYYGRDSLQYRAALPFPVVNIGGLAVPYPYAVLGSGAAAAQMVVYAQPGDNYESFTDFTGALSDDPIMAFDSTPWGDAAGAAESGEDAGVGGGLSNGKC
jgi:hypothetical protein